jgi:hypothetical protein
MPGSPGSPQDQRRRRQNQDVSIYNSKRNADEKHDKKSIAYDTDTGKKKKKEGVVEIGVFFDGTGNNMANTDATASSIEQNIDLNKLFQNERVKQRNDALNKVIGDSSYGNEYTNVARLFKYADYKADKYQDQLYVEGIGTEAGKEDDSFGGKASGSGHTGIIARVKKACEDAAKKVVKIVNDNPKVFKPDSKGIKHVQILVLDVFGFSRGAAAARHFVHEVNKPEGKNHRGGTICKFGILGTELEGKKILVDYLVIRFLGLFDTVSSFGEGASKLIFSNDVEELSLDDIGMSKKMIHFTAGDEHREYFALTTARSNNDGKASELRFVEKMLPGAHSDVGGSYVDGMKESVAINLDLYRSTKGSGKLALERQQLVRDGWYLEDEITFTKIGKGANEDSLHNLTGIRTLSNKYSYIPLEFMHRLALESEVPFKPGIDGEYAIDGGLSSAKAKLEAFVFGGGTPWVFKLEDKEYKKLRNMYLHWSAKLEVGKTANIVNGKRGRDIYNGVPGSNDIGKVIQKGKEMGAPMIPPKP